jgi:hypothetical protein
VEGEAATCVVRPDVDDQALGMLFCTLAVTAGKLDYS